MRCRACTPTRDTRANSSSSSIQRLKSSSIEASTTRLPPRSRAARESIAETERQLGSRYQASKEGPGRMSRRRAPVAQPGAAHALAAAGDFRQQQRQPGFRSLPGQRSIRLASERFLAPEILFNPQLYQDLSCLCGCPFGLSFCFFSCFLCFVRTSL